MTSRARTTTTPPKPGSNNHQVTDKRQRAFHSAKDYETTASQIGVVVAPEPDERRKASLVVAANVPRDEVVEILMMLGIHPDQPDWDDGPITAPSRQFNALDGGGKK